MKPLQPPCAPSAVLHPQLVLQPRDFRRVGLHPQQVSRLVDKGKLIRIGRGRYLLPEGEHSKMLGLALVANAVPHSVVCLWSALSVHRLESLAPREELTLVK